MEPNIAPLAKRLAEENNVNWRGLSGTGSDGRIIERDVLEYLAKVMAGDEDINPTSEPVPEGMEAWPEEDTQGFFESETETDASMSDSGANWASATDKDVLSQIEEEELDFNLDTVEAEADDLLKKSGVFLTSEDNFDLELDNEIFSLDSEDTLNNDLSTDSLTEDIMLDQTDVPDLANEEDISEDVFLFGDDAGDITEVDVVIEDFIQAEDDEITNLFSNDQEDLISEDMLIDQQLSIDSDEPSLELDSDDLFASSIEEPDEDLASLFIDDEVELNSDLDSDVENLLSSGQDVYDSDINLNPGLNSDIENLLAPSPDPYEAIDVEAAADVFAEPGIEDALELEADIGEELNLNVVEEIEAESLEITEEIKLADIEEITEEITVESLGIEADINEELNLDIVEEVKTESVDLGASIAQDKASKEAIEEMESLESILEDFEDNLDVTNIEDIAVAELADDGLNINTATEDLLADDVSATEIIEELVTEPEISLDTPVDLLADDVSATEIIEDASLEPAGLIGAGLVAAGAVAATVASQEKELEAVEEIAEIAAEAELIEEALELDAFEEEIIEEEVIELESSDSVEEITEIKEAIETEEIAMPSVPLLAPQQIPYGVLLRRQIDLSGLLEASSEVSKELADTVPSSVFLLKAAAKAAQKSGLADMSKLAFASFGTEGMQIRAIESARIASFAELSKTLAETSSVLDNLEDIDLVIADISGLELDEAVLNIAAPVMTLGRIEYGFDGARSVLSISGDISIEAGAKFISIFAELIESPIRLLV